MRKGILFLLLVAMQLHLLAQKDNTDSSLSSARKLEHSIHLGYNIGGSSPVPLPNTIREIKSYSPGFSPAVGYEAQYSFNGHWGISAGVRYTVKGMKITDSVIYFHTLISMDSSVFEGDFTGTNKTICKNAYVEIPVTTTFTTRSNWRFKLGLYAGFLVRPSFYGDVTDGYIRKGNSLGEKVAIDTATFNFDNELKKFDLGIQAGAEKVVWKRLAITGNLQWGLIPLFPSSFKGMGFKMNNIFFTLGVRWDLPDILL